MQMLAVTQSTTKKDFESIRKETNCWQFLNSTAIDLNYDLSLLHLQIKETKSRSCPLFFLLQSVFLFENIKVLVPFFL